MMAAPPAKATEAAAVAAVESMLVNKSIPDEERGDSLSKHAKGRLKKLLKRANSIDPNKDASGLIEEPDWMELQQLLQARNQQQHPPSQPSQKMPHRSIPSPKISWRRGKEQTVEAADHRDILFRLVGPTGKKRKHSDNNDDAEESQHRDDGCLSTPRLPAWASIHNPAQVEQAAVLEFHCTTSHQYQALQTALNSVDGSFGTDTRWFVGLHHPRSMSHALLYAAPPKPRKSPTPLSRIQSVSYVYNALSLLTVDDKVMKTEGYPSSFIASNQEEDDDTSKVGELDADTTKDSSDFAPRENLQAQTVDQPLTIPEVAASNRRVQEALVPVVVASEENQVRSYIITQRCQSRDAPSMLSSLDAPRVFALDCEMVQTTLGRELARVTLLELIDFVEGSSSIETRVRLDHLVQPRGTILDYLTAYSGITKELLESNPTYDLVQIQAALLGFVTQRDIVVGHSLENDLHALQWVHARVVDTALLLRAEDAKFKHSLRHLAQNLLRRTIQQDSHCSCEDARTALELAIQRLVKGPSFARHLLRPSPVNQLVTLSQHAPVVCLGASEWLQQHVENRSSIHALTSDALDHPNHKAIAAWLTTTNPVRRAKLVYGSWILPSNGDEASVASALTLLNKLRSQLSPCTLICVALQLDYHRTMQLADERRARMNPKATVAWTDLEQVEWTRAVQECRNGKVYWMMGNNR